MFLQVQHLFFVFHNVQGLSTAVVHTFTRAFRCFVATRTGLYVSSPFFFLSFARPVAVNKKDNTTQW